MPVGSPVRPERQSEAPPPTGVCTWYDSDTVCRTACSLGRYLAV